MVLVQFLSFFIVKDLSYPKLLILAYCFGGVINHSLMLGMCVFVLTYNSCIIIYLTLNMYTNIISTICCTLAFLIHHINIIYIVV